MRRFGALDDASPLEHSIGMRKVVVQLKLTNSFELEMKRRKLLTGKPRSVRAEALVDTGATRLYLQSSLIKALGLPKQSEVQSKTTNGVRRRAVFAPVRLELMGRYGDFNVVEVDDDVPNLLGQIPLEYLDAGLAGSREGAGGGFET
jgi:predicted aspartyl protease